jgi:hypothetical protein
LHEEMHSLVGFHQVCKELGIVDDYGSANSEFLVDLKKNNMIL